MFYMEQFLKEVKQWTTKRENTACTPKPKLLKCCTSTALEPVYISRRSCRENGKFWIEWRVYARDAIGEFRVGTGYTLEQARNIAITYYDTTQGDKNHG